MTLGESTFEDATRTRTGAAWEQEQTRQTFGDAEEEARPSQQNVGQVERYTSMAAGGLAALFGLARRDTLGLVLAGVGGALVYRGATGKCPLYRALDIDTNTAEGAAQGRFGRSSQERVARGIEVTQAFTVDRSPEDLYQYWRKFDNLPRIMTHLREVRIIDDKRSHWVAVAPAIAGGKVEWDAEITEDVPNDRIAWHSLPGADVDTAGVVRFEAGPRGTVIRVEMRYVAPAGRLGKWIAKLFGESPEGQIREDLRNFKRTMEIGDVLTILGQSAGRCTASDGAPYDENNSYLMPPSV